MTRFYRGARFKRVVHKRWISKLVPVTVAALYYGRAHVEPVGVQFEFTPDWEDSQ